METLISDKELRDLLLDRLYTFNELYNPFLITFSEEEIDEVADKIVNSIRKADIDIIKRNFRCESTKKELDEIRGKVGKTHMDHLPISLELIKRFWEYEPRICFHTNNGFKHWIKDEIVTPKYPCYEILCEMWCKGNRADVALCYSETMEKRGRVVVPIELGYFPASKIFEYLLSPIEPCWEFWSHIPSETGEHEYFVFKHSNSQNHPFLNLWGKVS